MGTRSPIRKPLIHNMNFAVCPCTANSGLAEPIEWIDRELSGYTYDHLPEYRKIYGRPVFRNPYHGWCPIMSDDAEFINMISEVPILQPISDPSLRSVGIHCALLQRETAPGK